MYDHHRSKRVSRRVYCIGAMLVLSAQVWGLVSFHESLSFMWVHPAVLLAGALLLIGYAFRDRPALDSRFIKEALVGGILLGLVLLPIPILRDTGLLNMLVGLFFGTAMALMHALHRRAIHQKTSLSGFWTMIPVAGPLVALFLSGISAELRESGRMDRSVRRLPVAIPAVIGVSVMSALLGQYGVILFVLLPIIIGAVAAYAEYDTSSESAFADGVRAAMAVLTWVNFLLAILLIEGLVCLLMAAVIAYPLALVGSWIGTAMASWMKPGSTGKLRTIPLLVVIPLAAHVSFRAPDADYREVVTVGEADAPPERVWREMQNLEIGTETDDYFFKLGVAMPTGTRTPEPRRGGSRECLLSTGVMREVITTWQPPKRLEFAVIETPACMKELGLHGDIEAPHLTGRFKCIRGEFELEALPGGRTRITGKSLVRLDVHPTAYWGIWSDNIVHRVHRRVFNAIAEKAAKSE